MSLSTVEWFAERGGDTSPADSLSRIGFLSESRHPPFVRSIKLELPWFDFCNHNDTILVMQRSEYEAVTHPSMAVLVDAPPNQCDGWIFLSPENGVSGKPVKAITDINFVRLAEKLGKSHKSQWDFIRGALLLQSAGKKGDLRAAREAYELCSPELFGATDPEIVRGFIANITSNRNSLWMLLPQMAARLLSPAKLIYWQAGTATNALPQLAPGIYCPDDKTAVAAKMLLGVTRVCPRCHVPFLPKWSTQTCCSVRCREAHRVARWREQEKAKALRAATKKKARRKRKKLTPR
jgi:hypothetical protein